mgnify:CR=1 FL=1
MTLRYMLALLVLITVKTSFSQDMFRDYFTNKTLRFDFLLAGNHLSSHVFPVQIKLEPEWAGSRQNLVDPFIFGSYRYQVMDEATGSLIFSRGFCTLFQEWQTTAEAKITDRAFYQAVFFPFPKNKVKVIIENREWSGSFTPLFEIGIDPSDYFIHHETPQRGDIIPILENGKPEDHVDVVFLAEGYAPGEKNKFSADVKRMKDYLCSVAPYSAYSNSFNMTGIWTPSGESGTDIPGEHVYKNTRFNSTFYTFNVSRYLTTSDMKPVYDAAAAVPWDFLVVLVNSDRYGGGGFYNLLTVCTADHELSPRVLAHEFGHAFAGLADEYYASEVAYENYYNLAVEPWEPNITTLVDFGSKWGGMIADSIPVPTPRTGRYAHAAGVFEGGGYMAKGIYSPMQNCRMKSNTADEFCPVCKEAILKAIDWYTH